jgi:hypothetical protein
MKKILLSITTLIASSIISAQAASYGVNTFYAGEVAHTFVGTISFDKASYSVGETMIVYSDVNLGYDTTPSHYATFSIGYDSNPDTTPKFDGLSFSTGAPAFNSFSNQLANYSLSDSSVSFTVPSLSAGSHYLKFRPVGESSVTSGGVRYDQAIGFVDVYFTVTSAPPVTVDINTP